MFHKYNIILKQISDGEEQQIHKLPHAQKRTAKYKKAVFINPEYVIKGPYSIDDTKLLNNIKYSYLLNQLEDLLNLEEKYRSYLKIEFIGFCQDRYYLYFKNVGVINQDTIIENCTTKIEENVQIIPRGETVYRVSELEKNNKLSDDIKIASLQHLYLRYLLGIGDSGTHNILIRKDNSHRLIAGIDLEERRKEKDTSNLEFLDVLFKRASKNVKIVYSDYVKRIKKFNKNFEIDDGKQLEINGKFI